MRFWGIGGPSHWHLLFPLRSAASWARDLKDGWKQAKEALRLNQRHLVH
jgi:hypothetical protein